MNYVNRFIDKVLSIFGSRPDEACIPSHVLANDAISRKRPRDELDDDLTVVEDSPPKRTRTLGNILKEADMNRENITVSTSGTQTYGNLLLPSTSKILGSDGIRKTLDSWTTVIDDDDTMSPTKFKNRYKAPKHVRSPNKRSRTSARPSHSGSMMSIDLTTSPANSRPKTTMIAPRGIFGTPRRSPRSQLFKPSAGRINGTLSRDEYHRLLCSVLSDSAKETMRKPTPTVSSETIDLTETNDEPVIDLTTNHSPLRKSPAFVARKIFPTPVVQPNVITIDEELSRYEQENVTPRRTVPRLNSFEAKLKNNKYTDPKLTHINTASYERFVKNTQTLTKQFLEKSVCDSQISNAVIDEIISIRLQSHLKITEAVIIDEEEEEAEIETVKPELTKEMMMKIQHAWHDRLSHRDLLVSKFKLDLTRSDLITLKNLNWLNDAVINFYMELIAERGGTAPEYPEVYAFSTFFYPTLVKGYDRVRRYTRKVDLFSKELILVPIHLSVHWCMAKIDLKKKKIYYYDSMKASNQRALDALLDYLVQEHRDKKKEEFDTDGWELINDKEIPCQRNGSDCGVFACTFGEYSTRKSKFNFSQDDMPYMRQKMVYEILTGRLLL